jgi:hypothetical protein
LARYLFSRTRRALGEISGRGYFRGSSSKEGTCDSDSVAFAFFSDSLFIIAIETPPCLKSKKIALKCSIFFSLLIIFLYEING